MLAETSPIFTETTTNWDESQLLHLLRRSLFGVKRSDLEAFAGLSKEETVAQLLEPLPLPPVPLNDYQVFKNDPYVPKGEPWIEAITGWALETPDDQLESARIQSLLFGWLRTFVEQTPHIHYKMLMFWHNHFATEAFTVFAAKSSYQYFKTLWELSLGNFKDLVKAITLDPCMLNYLNGTLNVKEEPDENFARELQELFCIGKGPDAQFQETDIREAARVLTGWQLDWESFGKIAPAAMRFGYWNHDEGDKQFSSFYDNRVIQGRAGESGADELDELIDMVVEHPECAKFITRRLYRFFVHHDIDDSVEASVITPLANLFRENNYEILPLMQALLMHDAFYAQPGAMIKSPLSIMVGFWRTAEIPYAYQGDAVDEAFYTHQSMYWHMQDMGFDFGNPPNVAGWPAYYQVPSYDKLWVTVSSLINRISFTDNFIRWGFWTPSEFVTWDMLGYTNTIAGVEDPNLLIEELLRLHIAVPVDESIKVRLKAILLSNQANDYYWTDAWFEYVNNPGNEMARGVVYQRLRFFYQYLFQLPEYQLQ